MSELRKCAFPINKFEGEVILNNGETKEIKFVLPFNSKKNASLQAIARARTISKNDFKKVIYRRVV